MRAVKAKAIRQIIYRDGHGTDETVHMSTRRYVMNPATGAVLATGLRRAYKDAKADIKEM